VGSGREVHGKKNPRKLYAEGLRAEPASLEGLSELRHAKVSCGRESFMG
jgi:hypothetical protein